jgi:outer membrane lipoprotein SlyB
MGHDTNNDMDRGTFDRHDGPLGDGSDTEEKTAGGAAGALGGAAVGAAVGGPVGAVVGGVAGAVGGAKVGEGAEESAERDRYGVDKDGRTNAGMTGTTATDDKLY